MNPMAVILSDTLFVTQSHWDAAVTNKAVVKTSKKLLLYQKRPTSRKDQL